MSDTLRLFFALPVPAALASQIADWRQGLQSGGTPVHERDLHVTLAFLGSQPAARLPLLREAARQVQGIAPFQLRLDQLGIWSQGLLHLAPQEPPPALLRLQQSLGASLHRHGFVLEPRPYRPHLSLARHAQLRPDTSPVDFAWTVKRFALFSSTSVTIGPRYQQIDTWDLG